MYTMFCIVFLPPRFIIISSIWITAQLKVSLDVDYTTLHFPIQRSSLSALDLFQLTVKFICIYACVSTSRASSTITEKYPIGRQRWWVKGFANFYCCTLAFISNCPIANKDPREKQRRAYLTFWQSN